MGKIERSAELVTAFTLLLLALSSTASAVSWHNTGDTAYTAGAGAGTLSVTGVSLTCTGSSATGTSPSGTVVGSTYAGATGSTSFNGCTLSGLPTAVTCSYTVTGTSQSASVTSGTLDALCSVTQFGSEICKVEGQTSGSYTNPVSPSTFGKLVLAHSTTLRTTNGSAGSCPLGVGEASTLAGAGAATVSSAMGGAFSPHLGPVITRTA